MLGIKRMYKVRISTDKGVVRSDEKIAEGVLRWFGHVERMENDKILESVLVVAKWVGRRRGRLVP